MPSKLDPKFVFRTKAPWIMALLMRDFKIQLEDAAAIAGNLGYESLGLTKLQEIAPVVKGAPGGYGWPQWTASRRRAYMAWCKLRGFNPASDQANYGYLVVELQTDYRHAIEAVLAATGLEAKVKAFELAYERAGTKNYPARFQWARSALEAWKAENGSPALPSWSGSKAKPTGKPADARSDPAPTVEPAKPVNAPVAPPQPAPESKEQGGEPKGKPLALSKRLWSWLTTGVAGGGLFTGVADLDPWLQRGLGIVLVGLAGYAILSMPEVRRKLGLSS